MKSIIAAVTAVAISGSIYAADDLPSTYSMNCWDGTFAYNQLSAKVDGERLKFVSSGQGVGIYKNLVRLPSDGSWGRLSVSFSIPARNCKLSSSDSKIVTCLSDALTIEIKGAVGLNLAIDEKVEIKSAVVQIRKVDELSIWGNNTSGYELAVAENHMRSSPALVQRYFYGLSENETNSCKIK